MKKLLIFVFLLYNGYLYGQVYFDELYGAVDPILETTSAVIEVADSGYIFPLYSVNWNEDTNQIYLVKVNKFGIKKWSRTYGLEGRYYEATGIIPFGNDNLLIKGEEYFNDSAKVFVLKTDLNGQQIWLKYFTNGSQTCGSADIMQTDDGGIISCGLDEGWDSFNNVMIRRQLYIFKTDSDGNLLWQSTWGQPDVDEVGSSIIETPDAGFLIAGRVFQPWQDGDIIGLIVKFDSIGTFQWKKSSVLIFIGKHLTRYYLLMTETFY